MNLVESLLSAEFIRAFAWTLFHSLWQGALLALVAAVLLLFLRKHRPGTRYAILYILMMMLPVFFVATFWMTYDPGIAENPVNPYATAVAWSQGNQLTDEINTLFNNNSGEPWYNLLVRFFEDQAKWLVLLWFAGFLFFLLRFSGSLFYVYRLKTKQVYPVNKQWAENLRHLSMKIGLKKHVRMAESALAKIPMTLGYLKPVILLPVGTLSGVPPQQIDAILLHELAHILRKDYLLNIIQSVVELLFFYHPLTWWISGLIRQEREHICDDLAIGVNQDHINYIKALTTMEELNSKSPLLVSAITGSKKKLLLRVKRLLMPVKLKKGFPEGIIASVLLVSLIFALSVNALSVIPTSFDLTGRESGERTFNLLPFNPSNTAKSVSEAALYQPEAAVPVRNELPDTITATSRSGKVKISIYTDSTTSDQQKQLEKMAESMERQTQHANQSMKHQLVEIEMSDGRKPMQSFHSDEVFGPRVYVFRNDSIDTIFVVKPGEPFHMEGIEGFEWTTEALEDQMKDIGKFEWKYDMQEDMMRDVDREMEMVHRDMEKDYRDIEWQQLDIERDQHDMEKDMHDMEFIHAERAPSAEKIIRQELRDDALVTKGKKYIIELDSKAMYINGEKQTKEIYRKYRKLVESLEQNTLDGEDTFKLIF